MTKIIQYFLFYLAFCVYGFNALGQQNKIDSLRALIKKDNDDTNKIEHITWLYREFIMHGQEDSVLLYTSRVIALGSEIANPTNDPKITKAVKKWIANAYNIIGIVYMDQSDYPRALENLLKSLRINEDIGNKGLMAGNLSNIGRLYGYMGDRSRSLEYYLRALKINQEIGNKNWEAINLDHIGTFYHAQKEYSSALEFYFKALKINEALGNKSGIAMNLSNIGNAYKDDLNYPKALDYYFRSLKMAEEQELGGKILIAATHNNIATIYIIEKRFKEAEQYLMKALALGKEVGDLYYLRSFEESFSDLYYATGDYKKSLEHYKKAMAIKDTLFTADKNKEFTRKEMNFEFEKKEAAVKAKQDKKDAIAKEELKQKEQQRNYFIAGFALVTLLAVFILRGYRQKRKANFIITKQKEEVEKKNEIIEEKQKEILDSIRYAKRIQVALLPTDKYINNSLKK